ncbi:MAG: SLC13 family permease [Anaerolineae bacterium]|jgi:di/tricarboxylate transporter|nr:SLC13 family permease [Anaerolineae bacterium]
MTVEIALLLVIIVIAMILFVSERFPEDVVGIGVMVALILTGLIAPDQAFAGFGSDTFIFLLGLFILTAALLRTGVVEIVGRWVMRHAGADIDRLFVIIIVAIAILSSFISNTAATAFFVPMVLGIARRTKTSASKLLLPLAFSSIVTSSITLISTSTNIVVSGLIQRSGLEPMGMFELAPVGLPIGIVGLIYLYVIRRWLPDRGANRSTIDELITARYSTEVIVPESSTLSGRTLAEINLGTDFDLYATRLTRQENGKTRYITPKAATKLLAGDVLLVEGGRDDLLRVKDLPGLEFKADVKFAEVNQAEAAATEEDTQTPPYELAELLVVPNSPMIGRTLRSYQFRDRFGVQVLAIHRHGESLRRKLSQIRLRMGDILLVQGKTEDLAQLESNDNFRILGAVQAQRVHFDRAPLAVAIFLGVMGIGTLGITPFSVAVLIGALLVFITRCLTPEEAYREVQWRSLILIGSMLALGVAMQETGTAEFIAGLITNLVGSAAPFWVLSAFFVLTVILTQPMSNQAAAVVVIPIALATATQLGLNPRAFAMTIALAASCSYLTPLEPSCLMVYGPGGYKFVDFLKAGALLTVLIYIITMILVPIVWPLNG